MKKSTVYSWIDRAHFGNSVVSSHFDFFVEYLPGKVSGLDFIKYVYDFVSEYRLYLGNKVPKAGNFRIVIFIPIDVSDKIQLWRSDRWSEARKNIEPPAIYIINSGSIFEENIEEYRTPISIPFECDPHDWALFRSFRDQEAIHQEWEFTTGIYFVMPL